MLVESLILNFLEARQILLCKRLNRTWTGAARNPGSWKYAIVGISQTHKCAKQVAVISSVVQHLSLNFIPSILGVTQLFQQCTKLKSLCVYEENDVNLCLRILLPLVQHLQHLESLSIHWGTQCFRGFEELKTSMPQLKHLILTCQLSQSPENSYSLCDFNKAFPKLKSFRCEGIYLQNWSEVNQLNSLTLRFQQNRYVGNKIMKQIHRNNPNLTYLDIVGCAIFTKYEEVEWLSNLRKLETLCLGSQVGNENFDYLAIFASPSLHTLVIKGYAGGSSMHYLFQDVGQMKDLCAMKQVQCLEFHENYYDNPGPGTLTCSLDLTLFTQFIHLKELRLVDFHITKAFKKAIYSMLRTMPTLLRLTIQSQKNEVDYSDPMRILFKVIRRIAPQLKFLQCDLYTI